MELDVELIQIMGDVGLSNKICYELACCQSPIQQFPRLNIVLFLATTIGDIAHKRLSIGIVRSSHWYMGLGIKAISRPP